jgi:hypothetical protein
MATVYVHLHIFGTESFPLPDAGASIIFDRKEKIGDLNQWVRRQAKTHPQFQPGARVSVGIVVEDPDQEHRGWIGLKKGHSTCNSIGFIADEDSTVGNVFDHINTLLSSAERRGSRIIFNLPVIEYEYYPLNDPRNGSDLHPSELTDDSAEECQSRSSRGRSLGVDHKAGRKRGKTPVPKGKKVRYTIKVPEIDVFELDELLKRPEELLSVYRFWDNEAKRLDEECGPLPPPLTQSVPQPSREGSLSLLLERGASLLLEGGASLLLEGGASVSADAEDGSEDAGEAEKEAEEVVMPKERGRGRATKGATMGGLAIRKSSRAKKPSLKLRIDDSI